MADRENLLAEYSSCQATYLHYDAFRWQSGSFLLAGVFVFWGLLVQQPLEPAVVAAGAMLAALLMSAWALFAHHYRQIYLYKLHRLKEIEKLLGMEQHRRFDRSRPGHYVLFGPRGHVLDVFVYVVVALGGAGIGATRNGFSPLHLLPAPLVLTVVAYVVMNERRVVNQLRVRSATLDPEHARNDQEEPAASQA
ncbi:hypothetical protein M2302_005969 [Micromonospora sp. A200]|uniref:hypothetical protein n=1 Tax=Micromonospora sp. A200 TaxID=2940568 RepID=UPI002476959D|nr:hypothetical protein [Micromonospora sp. A200]MDH6465767.1 hypothetical protein [Micromonospora sp. A200]